jgi:cephalosporin-C deacetylase-like acetyl esterase
MMHAWKASTMSKVSQRVPEPFLSTYNRVLKIINHKGKYYSIVTYITNGQSPHTWNFDD